MARVRELGNQDDLILPGRLGEGLGQCGEHLCTVARDPSAHRAWFDGHVMRPKPFNEGLYRLSDQVRLERVKGYFRLDGHGRTSATMNGPLKVRLAAIRHPRWRRRPVFGEEATMRTRPKGAKSLRSSPGDSSRPEA